MPGTLLRSSSTKEGPVEDTWVSRDLPVLDAVVRLLDEGSVTVAVRDITEVTGFDPKDVDRALNALSGLYVRDYHKLATGGDPNPWYVTEVTAAARRAVGQWPTADSLVGRVAEGLQRRCGPRIGCRAERQTSPGRGLHRQHREGRSG
jgi:hypothetical protein